jgi:peptidyl-tRNA hydrolase
MGGFKDFIRFGIGIGRPEQRDQNVVANYVLANFPLEEIEKL